MRLLTKISLTVFLLIPVNFVANIYGAQTTGETESKSTNQTTAQVDIKLFTFKPKVLEVPIGTTVIWINRDAIEHTITQGTPEEPADGFDSGFFKQGETFSFTFKETGSYSYFCKRHNFMHGKIKVVPEP